eukprot:7450824-Alexandrium_andersonii.AAC.1
MHTGVYQAAGGLGRREAGVLAQREEEEGGLMQKTCHEPPVLPGIPRSSKEGELRARAQTPPRVANGRAPGHQVFSGPLTVAAQRAGGSALLLSLIHISEPTRLALI